METKSRTPFTDAFFQKGHTVHYFTMGSDPQAIFEHFKKLDLSNSDACRLIDATGIDVRNSDWSIGEFQEPTVICGRLYPKHTVALFQGEQIGSRFAMFGE